MKKANSSFPKVLVVGGLHGDEISPLFILNSLKNFSHFSNLIVFDFVNMNGLAKGFHEDPESGLDLNRNFHMEGIPKIAEVRALIQKAEIIIDLHTHRHTETLPYAVIIKDFDKKGLAIDIIRKLGLAYFEEIKIAKQKQRLEGTLFYYASTLSKTAIVIEMSNLTQIKKVELKKIEKGIISLVSQKYSKSIPIKLRRYSYDKALVITKNYFKLGENIKSGDTLFSAVNLSTFQSILIKSQHKGILVTRPLLGVVNANTTLYRLG